MKPQRAAGGPTSFRRDRFLFGASAALSGAVLIVARLLEPSASGVGTHQQLGLPPCFFHALTGHGCPGCGLTTAFSYMARGDVGEAWNSNPCGVFFFVITALAAPFFMYRTLHPSSIDRYVESPWLFWGLTLIAGAMFATWVVRFLFGVV